MDTTMSFTLRLTYPQVQKLVKDRLMRASGRIGLTREQLQDALSYPGTGLEDETMAIFLKYSAIIAGIVNPQRAVDTGLVPASWSVQTDRPEARVNLSRLDYDYHLADTDDLLTLAMEQKAIGSLGFAAELLKAQEKGKEIFPVEARQKHCFLMPYTVVTSLGVGIPYMSRFDWVAHQWVLSWHVVDMWLFKNRRTRLVRIRE